MALKMEKTLAGMMVLSKVDLTDLRWVPRKDSCLADKKVGMKVASMVSLMDVSEVV